MAKGSEQFAWKHYGDVPHVCDDCGKALKVSDVAQANGFPRVFFRCTECYAQYVREVTAANKRAAQREGAAK